MPEKNEAIINAESHKCVTNMISRWHMSCGVHENVKKKPKYINAHLFLVVNKRYVKIDLNI